MPLTGSQPAKMVSRLHVTRLGASRLGYAPPVVMVLINGINRTALHQVRIEGLSIQDYLDGTPNTATLRVSGFTPTKGHEIKIGLGDTAVSRLVFAGHILRVTQAAEAEKASNVVWDLECISYEWLLNRRKVTAKFQSTSATTIVTSLMSTFTSGFTTTKVEAGLEALDEITFTNEEMMDALDRVARRIGAHWVVDYGKNLYFGVTSDGAAQPIWTAAPQTMGLPHVRVDLSQAKTRISVEGAGSTALAALVPGDTLFPVGDAAHFNIGGGVVAVAQNKPTYTGLVVGGKGALVGTTVTPTNAPTPTPSAATGMSAGFRYWTMTFVTAAGETLPGPSDAATIGGAVAPPSSAPSAVKAFDGNLSAGIYRWRVSYVTAVGETVTGPASANVTMDGVADPQSAPTVATLNGSMADTLWTMKYSIYHAATGRETLQSGDAGVSWNGLRVEKSSLAALPAGGSYRFYRRSYEGGGPAIAHRLRAPDSEDASYYNFTTGAMDLSPALLEPTARGASNTLIYRQANLTGIPVSSDSNVTSRRIYRTLAGGSTFKLVTTIANNTATTYTDTVADASLGSDELSTATAVTGAANVSNISIGPSGTTARKVYRTLAGGTSFFLLTTIANNTTTTYTDTTPDGSLGAAPPVTDTSGLVTQGGDVQAGSTSMLVTSTGFAVSGGGWAFIGAMPIRYTGASGNSITGLPTTGPGSLTTTVRYGSEIIAASMLTGIPASGAGSIAYPVVSGEPVNLVVTVNDTAAQSAMASSLGSADPNDGIVEEYIQDNRLSETEARNRAQARLTEVKDPLVTVSYPTRDASTRSGREVTITLDAPWSVTGTYKIQSVTISQFDPLGKRLPLRTVEASSRRFRLEDYLRLLKAA